MKDPAFTHSDEQLTAIVLAGNRSAFEQIMARHGSYVQRLISGRVPDDRVADVLQDTFIAAYKSLPGFSQQKPLKNWLAGIAIRSCCNFWRDHYHHKEIPVSALSKEHLAWLEKATEENPGFSPLHQAATKEAGEILQWAMAHLSHKDRMVLSLTYLDGYSTGEAAELLGWSRINVKVRSLRAKNKLRKILFKIVPNQGEPR